MLAGETMLAGMQVSRSPSGRLFQQAGVFCEVRHNGVLGSSLPASNSKQHLIYAIWRTQPVTGSYGETRASPSPLENQTYPPPAASPPSPILAMGPISSEATMCIVRGSTRTSRNSLTWTIAHTPPP